MTQPFPDVSSRAKSRAYLSFLREARMMRPGCVRGAKARDGVEGSLLKVSPSVAQALLPVLLRPRLRLYRHLQSARTVSFGEPPTQ